MEKFIAIAINTIASFVIALLAIGVLGTILKTIGVVLGLVIALAVANEATKRNLEVL